MVRFPRPSYLAPWVHVLRLFATTLWSVLLVKALNGVGPCTSSKNLAGRDRDVRDCFHFFTSDRLGSVLSTDLFVAFGKKLFDLQPSIIGGWPDVQSSYVYGQCQHVPMCGDTPKSSVILVDENSNTLNMLLRIHCFGLMNWVKLWRAVINIVMKLETQ